MGGGFIYRIVGYAERHAVPVIVVTALLSVALGYFALRIKVNADVWEFLPERAEPMQLIREYSGSGISQDYLIVVVQADNPFTLERLQAFDRTIRRIESLPHVHESINPFNFVRLYKEGRRLGIAPMSPGRQAPQTRQELQEFQRHLTSDPLARKLVISEDPSTLAALFPTDILDDYTKLLAQVNGALQDLSPYYRTYLAGQIPIVQLVKESIVRDLPKLLAAGIAVILLVLFLGFRSKRAVLLPVLVVGLGTLWTTGVMSLLGYTFTIASVMVPPLVLTLGNSYSIHVLNQYYREATRSTDQTWIASSVSHINQTILMAALTTIIGFGSLMSATLRQIRQFGVSVCLGVAFCALLSLVFFPAVLSVLRPPTTRERRRVTEGGMTRLMNRLAVFVVRWRYVLLGLLIALVAGFAFSVHTIRYQTDYLSYFRRSEKVVEDNLFAVRKFGGFVYLQITVSAPQGESGYFLQPEALQQVARFEDRLNRHPDVATHTSFVGYLRTINQIMTGRQEVPDTRPLILLLSRYFRAIAASESGEALVGSLVNQDFSRLTIVMRIYNSGQQGFIYEVGLKKLVAELHSEMESYLDPATKPVIWGGPMVSLYLSETLTSDQIKSALLAVVLVFLFTALVFRSFKYGFLALIPMLSGIMLSFVITSIARIPLDVVTVAFASVAVGVGIDDSLHLIIQYRRQLARHTRRSEIVAGTLRIAGRPILLTSISLMAGLLVLTLSSFKPILYFGVLISTAILTTTLGALIILPAILAIVRPR